MNTPYRFREYVVVRRATWLGSLVLALHVILHLASAARSAPTPVHHNLFLLLGQSNAAGRATAVVGLPPADPADAAIAYHYDTDTTSAFADIRTSGGDFIPLAPASNGRFGPEIGLGRALHGGGVADIAIVKYARGGTNLHTDWNPDATTGHRLYQAALAHYAAATAALAARGDTHTLRAVFWMQGESDSSPPHHAAYQANLAAFVARLRADLGAPALPFILGRVGTNGTGERLAVRDAQVFVAENTLRSAWIDTDDLHRFDGTHYDAPGTLALGQRFAAAYLDLTAAPASYGGWQRTHFTQAERASPAVSGPESAPAGDAMPNLLKYHLGASPRTPAAQLLPAPALAADGARLVLRYRRALSAPDALAVVEWSENLSAWHTEGVTEQVLSREADSEQVEAGVATAGRDRLFLRLRATAR